MTNKSYIILKTSLACLHSSLSLEQADGCCVCVCACMRISCKSIFFFLSSQPSLHYHWTKAILTHVWTVSLWPFPTPAQSYKHVFCVSLFDPCSTDTFLHNLNANRPIDQHCLSLSCHWSEIIKSEWMAVGTLIHPQTGITIWLQVFIN